jgi:hypothetical protein
MTALTPEQWEVLQAETNSWAAGKSNEVLSRFVKALQLNWKQTKSVDAWQQLQCLYAVQHERSSSV